MARALTLRKHTHALFAKMPQKEAFFTTLDNVFSKIATANPVHIIFSLFICLLVLARGAQFLPSSLIIFTATTLALVLFLYNTHKSTFEKIYTTLQETLLTTNTDTVSIEETVPEIQAPTKTEHNYPQYSWAQNTAIPQAFVKKDTLKNIFRKTITEITSHFKSVFNQNTAHTSLKVLSNNVLQNIKNIHQSVQADSYNFILYTYTFIFAYLDIFFAFLFLNKKETLAYMLFSIFFKLLFVYIFIVFKKEIAAQPKKYILGFMSLSSLVAFILLSYSFIPVTVFFGENFLAFKTSFAFIFVAQFLFAATLTLLYAKKDFIQKNPKVQNLLLKSFYTILAFCSLSLLFFHTTSIDSVALFFIGINLFFLTTLYHLFYRIHIYIQLA